MGGEALKKIVDIVMKVHDDFVEKCEKSLEDDPASRELYVLYGKARGATDIVKQIVAALRTAAEEEKI